jgi:hypothetical protein
VFSFISVVVADQAVPATRRVLLAAAALAAVHPEPPRAPALRI